MARFHIKEAIGDKVKDKRNYCFTKVNFHDETNVARKSLPIDIRRVRKSGRPKHNWANKMRQRQQRYGLMQQENEIANARRDHEYTSKPKLPAIN